MRRDIEGLKKSRFDILVIGGGINGCAIARDASLRGAKTALIERDDFACGSSGKTTKLIHGGIRYLERFNFKLVYEALHERAVLLRTVPHLVRPIEFIIPVYKGDPRSLSKIRAGVFIYDRMAGKENICGHRGLSGPGLAALETGIDTKGLKGGVIYCDAQMDDARLCLDNAVSAYQAGCVLANKVEAAGFTKENGKVSGVEAMDRLTGIKFPIHAAVVINATGAWSNRILKVDDPNTPPITRPTKGAHIVYRKLPHARAILISAYKDKRVFFVIPWRGMTLIGTTDIDYSGSYDEVHASSEEIDYLLGETRRIFPRENITKEGIIATFAGLRPLVNTPSVAPWHVSREHLIRESGSGLISVVGGKYTTYRRLAQQVVDAAVSKLKGRIFKDCVTDTEGPSSPDAPGEKKDFRALVEYAVKEEMAVSLVDLLARRLQLSTTPSLGLDRLNECADIMAWLLNWSEKEKARQMALYKDEIMKNSPFQHGE
ncbi:MAG: glycerol-3-phosphate dehydrogenase/oxidase [Candidatus Omnitrophica bacterium]|nr:glycerol-3-phosphate dehydrogenase/oxidase [Candidatus Omnitrophota bacterium]